MQGLPGEIEVGDFLHLEVDFRAQQRALRALELVFEELVEGHVHERGLVVVMSGIGQQGHAHLLAEHFRVELAYQLIGQHRTADAATHNDNMPGH